MSSFLLNILLLFICGQMVMCQDVYRAAIIGNGKQHTKNYASLIHEAAKLDADILLLETVEDKGNIGSCSRCDTNYDAILKAVSTAAKETAIYVGVHVYEKITCNKHEDIVRSNLIFNRNGDIISVSRKPWNKANCNSTYSNSASFSTDFGVKFGVLMEEDILNVQDINFSNYIILGSRPRTSGKLHASQFESSWAFISKINVVSTNGIYGNTGATIKSNNIIVKEIKKEGNNKPKLQSSSYNVPDLARSIKLDLELAMQGYKENVCFEEVCCHFYVKLAGKGNSDVSYNVGVHAGTMDVGSQTVATRGCVLVACAGSDQSCSVLSRNSSEVTFKTISISSNFSQDCTQFPILQTTDAKNIKFNQQNGINNRQVNMEIYECNNVLNFGIISIESKPIDESSEQLIDFSSYITSENVQEFFDYLWIRLRFPIFIISIYILEMM
ncbi:vanin-like protein 3 [Pieris rapae]|uniref:vanin-like protein 3 n=1 Tax=Pieris rapae TaxID=64459 RepID=UPI001E27D3BB|nr:vanin-like protein 3 [Pieris rapae]